MKSAFNAVDHMITAGQLDQLSKDFKTCEPIRTKDDIYQFVTSLAFPVMFTVQANYYLPGVNIKALCENITVNDPYKALVKIVNLVSIFCTSFYLINVIFNYTVYT